jgi:hypothetical protein
MKGRRDDWKADRKNEELTQKEHKPEDKEECGRRGPAEINLMKES